MIKGDFSFMDGFVKVVFHDLDRSLWRESWLTFMCS